MQPYIALGLGLKKEGHRVTIATHEEYKSWIEGFGIEHRTTGGDPGALMKLSVEHRVCMLKSSGVKNPQKCCLSRCFLLIFSRRVLRTYVSDFGFCKHVVTVVCAVPVLA